MHHTIDICEQLAEKLSQPEFISALVKYEDSSVKEQWRELSLAHGWPGLALFYSILNNSFPNVQYDQLAHTYLELTISKLPSYNFLPISLLQGVTGICFATHLCSKDGERYSKLRIQLDQLLIEKLDEHLVLMERNPFPNTYYLAHGISGVLAYLLLKQNDTSFRYYIQRCLSKLVQVLNRQISVSGYTLPGWYEPCEYLWKSSDKEKYPKGKFSLGMLTGVSGILSSLSVAAAEGVSVYHLHETISVLADWLVKKQRDLPNGAMWPKVISFEEEIGETSSHPSADEGWEEETPFIARSLYLAGKVLNQNPLKLFAEDVFLRYLSAQEKRDQKDLSFIKGKAGLLVTAYRMSQDTHNPVFF